MKGHILHLRLGKGNGDGKRDIQIPEKRENSLKPVNHHQQKTVHPTKTFLGKGDSWETAVEKTRQNQKRVNTGVGSEKGVRLEKER